MCEDLPIFVLHVAEAALDYTSANVFLALSAEEQDRHLGDKVGLRRNLATAQIIIAIIGFVLQTFQFLNNLYAVYVKSDRYSEINTTDLAPVWKEQYITQRKRNNALIKIEENAKKRTRSLGLFFAMVCFEDLPSIFIDIIVLALVWDIYSFLAILSAPTAWILKFLMVQYYQKWREEEEWKKAQKQKEAAIEAAKNMRIPEWWDLKKEEFEEDRRQCIKDFSSNAADAKWCNT